MKYFLTIIFFVVFYLVTGCSGNSSVEEEKKDHAPRFGMIIPQQDSAIYAGNTVKFYAVMIDEDKDIANLKIYINDEQLSNSENPGYELDTLYLNGVQWATDQCTAGVYKVKMELFDKAGNKADTVFTLNIKNLTLWSRTYSSGTGCRAAQTSDSCYVISSESSILKLDQDGTKLWEKQLENCYSSYMNDPGVVPLQNGGCYVSASVYHSGNVHDDVRLMKLDGSGSVIWQQDIAGQYLGTVTADKQENLYLGTGSNLYKYKSDGQQEWLKQYSFGISTIYSTPQNELLLFGNLAKSYDSDSLTICLQKIDSDGNEKWNRQFELIGRIYGNRYMDRATNGDYLAAFRYYAPDDSRYYILLIRFSDDGTVKLVKKINFDTSYYFFKLVADRNNGFFLLSYYGIHKFDAEGNLLEQITNAYYINDLIPTFDGKYFLSGSNLGYIWGAKIDADLKRKHTGLQHLQLDKQSNLR